MYAIVWTLLAGGALLYRINRSKNGLPLGELVAMGGFILIGVYLLS